MIEDRRGRRAEGRAKEEKPPPAGRRCWLGCEEPDLDELLDDPLMTLLWRSDRLDCARVRTEIATLRAAVRRLD